MAGLIAWAEPHYRAVEKARTAVIEEYGTPIDGEEGKHLVPQAKVAACQAAGARSGLEPAAVPAKLKLASVDDLGTTKIAPGELHALRFYFRGGIY